MKVKLKMICIFLMAAFFVLIVNYGWLNVFAETQTEAYETSFDFEDNSLILVSDNSGIINSDKIGSLFKNYGIKEIKNLSPDLNTNIYKIQFSFHDKEKILDLIDLYSNTNGIECLEPNHIGKLAATANDYYFPDQWGLNGTYGISANEAWEITTGSRDVRVGVIDSGVHQHEDLIGNLAPGWNFVNDNDYTNDSNGHGTHVAGIIGAVGDNNIGISGVCKKVQIVPLKITNSLVWNKSHIIEAINYAQSLYYTENRIHILNFSGGGFPFENSFYTAIKNYLGLFVCSAGNENSDNDTKHNYPSDYDLPNIISVGAIDSNGKKSSISNYGRESVDLFAPGEAIYSTLPDNRYGNDTGTSMAAPHVAGVAALMLAKDPNLSATQLKSKILLNSDTISITVPTDSGGTTTQQVKKLNAYKAVNSIHNATHTEEYCKYYNASQHYVKCLTCDYILRLENHTFIPYLPNTLLTGNAQIQVAPIRGGKICTGCGYVVYSDGSSIAPLEDDDRGKIK